MSRRSSWGTADKVERLLEIFEAEVMAIEEELKDEVAGGPEQAEEAR
ncbi:MAG: hypothetical protein AAGM46_27630 [Cyanobacteria bacterium J06582_2]